MGSIDTARTLKTISHYNEKGKIIELLEYDKGYKDKTVSLSGKTTFKYTADDKLLEKTEYQFDKIRYKKIYEFNSVDKKSLVKVYFSSEDNSENLSLWGALRIYYNDFNKPAVKKWIGGIDLFEKEWSVPVNSSSNKLEFSTTDSAYAIYHYGKNKKLDTIKVYDIHRTCMDNDGKKYPCPDLYLYKYDNKDSLVEIRKPSILTKYAYKDGKLIEEKEIGEYGWALTKTYNDFKKLKSIVYDVPSKEKLNYKIVFEYNDNHNEVKRVEYNYLNEPTKCLTTEYEYY
jgi:hypothetical protein